MILDGKVPPGPLAEKWDRGQQEMKLISPANKRKFTILVVGTGLAGASAAATLGELGYQVEAFCFQDSPRRGHSIEAQGGINASKNYPNDGDGILRLFYDTLKGGDFRSREANVYRLAMLSNAIIDQCVAQGVPFARDYAGYLENRSFGGTQVSRTFYARGQTGQQLLLGAYGALSRQVRAGTVRLHPRTEMLDLVAVDGGAKGIIARDLVTGHITPYAGDAVCLCTGGMQTYITCRPMRWGPMSQQPTVRTKKGPFLQTPALSRSTPPAFPQAATISQNSPLCQNL
jgi:succinate dehydrogenase / fumarate reductase flavoprotein subunit